MPHHPTALAKKIWDYCSHRTPLVKSDAIIVLCSHDIRIAEHAARLHLEGWAPLLVFSGGLSKFTSRIYKKSEAETFADVARALGVPAEAIILEKNSTNTQENLELTMSLMAQMGKAPKRAILVQKPNMLRRVYATAAKLFPDLKFATSSHEISFEEAPHEHVSQEMLIHELAGDIQRIKVYVEKGFIVPQEIDAEAWRAFEKLVELGFTKNLVK